MHRSPRAVGLSALVLVLAGVGFAGSVEVSAAGGAFCHGQEATIVGTAGTDIRATNGPDVIVTNGARVGCGYLGEDAEAVARGGRGDDTLVGEYMPDTLIGGPGNDFANGRRNVDRCVAETEIRCDR